MSSQAVRSNDQPGMRRRESSYEVRGGCHSHLGCGSSKDFYVKLGWRLDDDFDDGKDFRVTQLSPPGSGCSIISARTSPRQRLAPPTACT